MLQQYFPDNDTNHFHSSGYAEAAHGQAMGAASTQSYRQRLQIERNRRHVNRYGHSMLGRVDSTLRPRFTPPDSDATERTKLDTGTSRPIRSPVSRPSGFREPPTRGYNPYS